MQKFLVMPLKALLFIAITSYSGLAHNVSLGSFASRSWTLNTSTQLRASYLYMRNDSVALELESGAVYKIALSSLSSTDQKFVRTRYEHAKSLNTTHQIQPQSQTPASAEPIKTWKIVIVLVLLTLLVSYSLLKRQNLRARHLGWISVAGFLALFQVLSVRSTELSSISVSPAFVDSAFAPFKPNVITSWDAQYFHVESNGIPAHEMMKGITSWQQQVPLPQCYLGQNAWLIPLNPVASLNPITVDQTNFTRGAIAIAVNGVSIFNPYTNTGVDALLDGQLDEWGGHSGRADDYHYHIAPLHLYNGSTVSSLPIAFALDGFPVYGNLEPNGSAMQPLDINHGHIGGNGLYHYHGTPTAPYMIARFYGQVTQDTTHQLVPQPRANPVRPATSPLKGAVITGCVPSGADGYILTYTLSGQTYAVSYRWASDGTYTYDFITPTGTTTQTYHGFTPCQINAAVDKVNPESGTITVVPNPAHGYISIGLPEYISASLVQAVEIVSMDGLRVYYQTGFTGTVSTHSFSSGSYFVFVRLADRSFVQKLVVR